MNFTDKLRQLHEQATQGEWRTYSIFGPDYTEIHGMRKDGEVQVTDSQANATLICLLRNKVPELLELLDAAQQFARITAFIPETHDTIRSNLLRAIAKLEEVEG